MNVEGKNHSKEHLLKKCLQTQKKSGFLMSWYSLQIFSKRLTPEYVKQDANFRKAIMIQQCVAIGLWRLLTGDAFYTKTFGVGNSVSIALLIVR